MNSGVTDFASLDLHGVKISHLFGGGVYAKETRIPAGVFLQQHVHKYDHLSILASGRALVEVEGSVSEFSGPACLVIKAGKSHKVTAVTDAVWYCVHATSSIDESTVDSSLIMPGGM